MKTLVALLLTLSSLFAGSQLEIPLNVRVLIGFTAPYVKNGSKYKTNFPYLPYNRGVKEKEVPILDFFDMNLDDNNITKLQRNEFELSSISKLDPYVHNDIVIEVSTFDNVSGTYLTYSSKNSVQSNSLSTLEVGKGYYVLISSQTHPNRVGFISDRNYVINVADYNINKDGWHMVSLSDDLLSQTSSALFIPYSPSTFSLSSTNNEFVINVSFDVSVEHSVRALNNQIRKQRAKGYPFYTAAYPVKRFSLGNFTDGIIIISDTFIETTNNNAMSITNRALIAKAGANIRGLKENMIAFRFSDENLSFPSKLSIFNVDNNKEVEIDLAPNGNANTYIPLIETALQDASESLISDQGYGIYKIDGNFDGSNNYSYTLLALDSQFGIKEQLTIKTYNKTSNIGRFQVKGLVTKRINNLETINDITADTTVYYQSGTNTFMIASTTMDDIDILEEGSSVISEITTTSKGYISSFYKDVNFFNMVYNDEDYDDILEPKEGYGNFTPAYYNNLENYYAYSRNLNLSQTLLNFSNIGYSIKNIYTKNLTQDGWLSISIDNLSRVQKLNSESSPIGSIYKEKAYFVQLAEKSNSSIEINEFKEKCKVTPHFNNTEDLKTTNNVICSYSFKTTLDKSDNLYSAIFIIGSKVNELVSTNGLFSFTIDAYQLSLTDNTDYNIIIALLDKSGTQIAKSPFVFYFKKPDAPFDKETKEIKIGYDTLIYKNIIYDTDQKKNFIGQGPNYTKSRLLTWGKLKGKEIELIAVNKNDKGLYSDIRKFIFVPNKSSNLVSLDQNNVTGHNMQLGLIVDRMTIQFEPLKNSGFMGGFNMMFLMADKTLLGSIIYDPRYAGKIFYVEYDDKLYAGEFKNSSKYNSDGSPYRLTLKNNINK